MRTIPATVVAKETRLNVRSRRRGRRIGGPAGGRRLALALTGKRSGLLIISGAPCGLMPSPALDESPLVDEAFALLLLALAVGAFFVIARVVAA